MMTEYLDYSKSIKIVFKKEDNDIFYSIIHEENERTSFIVKKHLESLITLEKMNNLYYLWLGCQKFLEINFDLKKIICLKKLTSFETRMLAQMDFSSVPLVRCNDLKYKRISDFHTHFTGAPRSEELLKLGKKYNIKYPNNYLKQMGIMTYDGDYVALNDLSKADIKILNNNLRMSVFSLETFEKMEKVYLYREVFTKNELLFPLIMESIAKDYMKYGIKYAELSFSEYTKNINFLKMINDTVPFIEEKYGVKLRFLIGIRRSAKIEQLYDKFDIMIAISKNPYIVGCDFMGHETNYIKDLAKVIKKICNYAIENDPLFVIRIHAGENVAYKDNVYDTLKIIDSICSKRNYTIYPNVRIGHGLYGVNDKVLRLAKKLHITIEFNMSSNLSLNNIGDIKEFPVKRYIDSGVSAVFGTDGAGLYSTYSNQEQILGYAAGLTIDDFDKISETEKMLILHSEKREKKLKNIELDAEKAFNSIKYKSKNNKPRYSENVKKKYIDEQNRLIENIYFRLKKFNVVIDEEDIEKEFKFKTPILITGASEKSIKNIDLETLEYIRYTARKLVESMNPNTSYLVTGGTNFGIEKIFHEEVNRLNQINEKKLSILGTFTLEARVCDIEPNTISHALILKLDNEFAKSWYNLTVTQLTYINSKKGHMIAIGGGQIVSDMIQMGYNLDVDMYLMDGPNGASTDKAHHLGIDKYSFKTVDYLINLLKKKDGKLFY